MFPNQVFYQGYIWEMGYSNRFGTGYRKLTATLKKHPKHIFMCQKQMLGYLKNDTASVAINPKPDDQIYDTELYTEWLKKQNS
jgi:hypothetical protein